MGEGIQRGAEVDEEVGWLIDGSWAARLSPENGGAQSRPCLDRAVTLPALVAGAPKSRKSCQPSRAVHSRGTQEDELMMRDLDVIYTKWPFYGQRKLMRELRKLGWELWVANELAAS